VSPQHGGIYSRNRVSSRIMHAILPVLYGGCRIVYSRCRLSLGCRIRTTKFKYLRDTKLRVDCGSEQNTKYIIVHEFVVVVVSSAWSRASDFG
jgi:hypothetical protein